MLEVGSIEQSERTALFTLRSENPDRTGAQQRSPESNPAGNPGGNPEGYPAAEQIREETLRPGGRELVTRWRPVCMESRQRRPWEPQQRGENCIHIGRGPTFCSKDT